MDYRIIQYFNYFLVTFQLKIIKFIHGCQKECQKKVLQQVLQQTKSFIFRHRNIVNLYITYKLDTWSKDLNTDFTLGNCLFGTAKKYKYSSYGKRLDSRSENSRTDGSIGKNAINFGVLLCIFLIEPKISQFLVKDQHKAQIMLQ